VRRAFTLIELLVTIAIISVLMGISIGVLSRLGHRNVLDANSQAVRTLLRRAHNASREERYGAIVELDRHTSELRAHQKTSITQFRFEDTHEPEDPNFEGTQVRGQGTQDDTPAPFGTAGARGYEMTVDGGEQAKGKYGLGVLFEQTGPEGAAWAFVEDRPALSPLEGVYVEAWIYLGDLESRLRRRPRRSDPTAEQEEHYALGGDPPRECPDRVLTYQRNDPPLFNVVRKGRAYALGVTASYEVEVALTGPEDPEYTYITRTRPGTLQPDRWYRIGMAYDGRRVRIFVNGIARMHLPAGGRRNLELFERLDQGGEATKIDDVLIKGDQFLSAGELKDAGELGGLLLRSADQGGAGNGDGLVTRNEFLDRTPVQLIRDTSPLIVSDPHPERAFYGVIDELKVAGVIRSVRLAIPKNIVLIAPEEEVAFDMLGQLDPARHPEPFVFYLTDDEKVWELLDPAPVEADPKKTMTRGQQAEQAKRNLALGRGVFARFQEAIGDLDPGSVRRVVVGRTGLVTE
jgi:prepilin-type N-terminal cleavage/methylation domain-containing protein